MQKLIKKITTFILAFILTLSMTPINYFNSYAEMLNPKQVKTDTFSMSNPAYEGLDIKTYSPKLNSSINDAPTFYTIEDAGAYLRDQMIKRNGTISFTINQSYYSNLDKDIFNEAVKDNGFGDSSAGDYLYWNYGGYTGRVSYYGSISTLTYNMNYLSTASQEQAVDREVKNVLDDLNVYNKDPYQKVLAVHDYIVKNIDYDYSLENHSGYNAIVDKNVVCQGFASITSKMLKELNIGVRVIPGNNSTHGWNIVNIGSYWYNTDNTWDENLSTNSKICYDYFLKGKYDFPDHTRDYEFDTYSFNTQFPTSSYAYVYTPQYNIGKVTNLRASDISSNSIELTWDKVYDADGYEIYTFDDEDNDFYLLSRTSSTNYTDDYLDPCTTHYYKVRAYKTVGSKKYYGDFSSIYQCTTDSKDSTLSISNYNYPTKIVRGNSFTLKGTISSNYLINYVTVKVLDEYDTEIFSCNKTVYPYSYSFSDLDKGMKFALLDVGRYKYQVFAADESGNEILLIDKDFDVVAPPISVKNITNLKYTSTTSSINLSWSKMKNINGYEVWVYKPNLGYYAKLKNISSSNTNYYNRVNLPSASMYRYKVRTYKISNGVKYYSKFTDEFLVATTPLKPVVKITTPSSKKVKLTWTNISSKTTGYQIYRATSKKGTYKKISTTTSKSFTNTGLTKGKYYYYKVRAYRVLENGQTVYSPYSTVKSIKVK